MISLFKKSTKSPSFAVKKEFFIKSFLGDPNHQWINKNTQIRRAFLILIGSLKEGHIDFFTKHPTYFIPCQAHLSCAIGRTQNHHLILAFPELITLLQSASYMHAVAVLAHELGHIYYQHTENRVETLKAQIEADDFAFALGFGEELQEVLLDHSGDPDCRARISYLSRKLIKEKR